VTDGRVFHAQLAAVGIVRRKTKDALICWLETLIASAWGAIAYFFMLGRL
jgi:hypothetical protein